jgi:hypothetical protein
MTALRRYRKRPDQFIIAVQLDLDTDGFTFRKWGGEQRCKRGDWIVDNSGETYVIDSGVFPRTYRKIGDGKYVKINPVWAEIAQSAGTVKTHEGASSYQAGDYLVYNRPDRSDAYCMGADRFEAMYELDEDV